WDAYGALQDELDERTLIDSEAWGLEEALNTLLLDPGTKVSGGATAINLQRVRNAAARRERHRAHVRVLRVVQGGLPDGELEYRVAEARETLNFLHLQVASDDWVLLEAVAEGVPYAVLARVR